MNSDICNQKWTGKFELQTPISYHKDGITPRTRNNIGTSNVTGISIEVGAFIYGKNLVYTGKMSIEFYTGCHGFYTFNDTQKVHNGSFSSASLDTERKIIKIGPQIVLIFDTLKKCENAWKKLNNEK